MNERLNKGKCNIAKNLDIIESKIKVKQKWENKKEKSEKEKIKFWGPIVTVGSIKVKIITFLCVGSIGR